MNHFLKDIGDMHIQLRVHIEWFSWIARQTPVYMYIVYRHACAGVCVYLWMHLVSWGRKTERLGTFPPKQDLPAPGSVWFLLLPRGWAQGTEIPALKLSMKSATIPKVPDGTHELPRGRGHQDVSCKRWINWSFLNRIFLNRMLQTQAHELLTNWKGYLCL